MFLLYCFDFIDFLNILWYGTVEYFYTNCIVKILFCYYFIKNYFSIPLSAPPLPFEPLLTDFQVQLNLDFQLLLLLKQNDFTVFIEV